jgi:RNA polymerase sigma factor (sigma-70 family)
MTGFSAKPQREHPAAAASQSRHQRAGDEQLIRACLKGDTEAWSALIDKYKNLIYSIPIKLGMYQDAADIFQSVCVDLLSDLPRLREPKALPKWLMQTCYHKCVHHQRQADRQTELPPEETVTREPEEGSLPEQMMVQLEQEQLLREVVASMPERCERMIRMLFYETPSLPYEEVAAQLGLAKGSIGFIRGRCLAQLKKQLEKKGFQ